MVINKNIICIVFSLVALTAASCWSAGWEVGDAQGDAQNERLARARNDLQLARLLQDEPQAQAIARLIEQMEAAAARNDFPQVNQLAMVMITMREIVDLPDEIIAHIAEFLDENSLKQLAQVNKRFKNIVTNSPRYKTYNLLNQHNGNPNKALLDAIKNNYPWAIDHLVQWGANVNMTERAFGRTMLMLATIKNNNNLVAKLLNNGANANANNQGLTALMIAITNENKEITNQLIRFGADYYKEFKKAINGNNRKAIRLLIPYITDTSDLSPIQKESLKKILLDSLAYAIMSNDQQEAQFLIQKGANPFDLSPEEQKTLKKMGIFY